jgi:hypothetical protein
MIRGGGETIVVGQNIHEWEAREREREFFIHPITPQTHAILRTLGLLKFYEEGTSLRGNSPLLQQFICH